jgi:hypothetical protein
MQGCGPLVRPLLFEKREVKMKALVIIMSAFLSMTIPVMAQQGSNTGNSGGQNSSQNQTDSKTATGHKNSDDMELRQDPRKSLGSRPIVVMPSGKVCKDSMLRETNGMDVPNEGLFPNPGNPNGVNDGNLNNNNGELPERMNCNGMNDIAPRKESPDSPLNQGSPIMTEPEE